MSSNQQFLQNLYEAFNKGEIETIGYVLDRLIEYNE